MTISADEIIAAMSGVSEQLITESMAGSRTIKDRIFTRVSTIAASAALVIAAGVFALVLAQGGAVTTPGTQPPGDTTDSQPVFTENVTVVLVDDTEVRLKWKLTAKGNVADVDITSSGMHTVELANTQGKFYESVMLFVDESFYVICDLRTGELYDFMREARYDFSSENTVWPWDYVKDIDGLSVHYSRYDGSGVYFIAVTFPSDMGDELRALWAYDYNTGTLHDARESTLSWMPLVWFEPKNGSVSASNGDGGEYLVTADFVHDYGYDDMRGLADYFPALGFDYSVAPAEDNPSGTAEIRFNMNGHNCLHHLRLSTGELTYIGFDEDLLYTNTTSAAIGKTEIEIEWSLTDDPLTGQKTLKYKKSFRADTDDWEILGQSGAHTVTVLVKRGSGAGIYLVDLLTGDTLEVGETISSLGINVDRYLWSLTVSNVWDKLIITNNGVYDDGVIMDDLYYVDLVSGKVEKLSDLPEIVDFCVSERDEALYVRFDSEFVNENTLRITVKLYDYIMSYFENGDTDMVCVFLYDTRDGSVTVDESSRYKRNSTTVEINGTPVTVIWVEYGNGTVGRLEVTSDRAVTVDYMRGDEVVLWLWDSSFALVNFRTGEVYDCMPEGWEESKYRYGSAEYYFAGWDQCWGIVFRDSEGNLLHVYDGTNHKSVTFGTADDPDGVVYTMHTSVQNSDRDRGFMVTVCTPDEKRAGVSILHALYIYDFETAKLLRTDIGRLTPAGAVRYMRELEPYDITEALCVTWAESGDMIIDASMLDRVDPDHIPDVYDYRYLDAQKLPAGREILLKYTSQSFDADLLLNVDTGELRDAHG